MSHPANPQPPSAPEQPSPGTVYLVGAGPGAPDLITRRGWELLRTCDALVYDSLVSEELLAECPAPERHFAGKSAGCHALSQDEINALLVSLATRSDGPRRIVRLKGGDPFVFGRGGEEALACLQHGIPVEVVPGVTAGLAVPAAVGIPVTHRNHCRGVALITAHQRDGVLDLPWQAYIDSGLTLVFYMGVAALPSIASSLIAHGMPPQTPAAMVQEGTLPGQRALLAPLEHLPQLSAEAGLRSPAIIVVGQTVALSEDWGLG